jgi:hypothetical protein
MPHFRKIERAKSVIGNGVELTLQECAKCKAEFYGTATQLECDICRKVDGVADAVRPMRPSRSLPPAITTDRGYKSSSKNIPSSSGRPKRVKKRQWKRGSK